MNTTPRILIVEDEPLIAEDIADLCRLNGYEVCGTAYSAGAALNMIDQYRPGLVLLDINLEDTVSGLDIAAHLREKYAIPFIFLTSYSDKDTLARAKYTTPLGYIVKPFNKEQLYSTIEIAWAQLQKNAAPELDLDKINAKLIEPLSNREAEVLACIFKGMNTKATADALYISINTVKFHIKNLYDKFDAHNRVELIFKLKQIR
jgi:two-component system, response regulator PdtaR